MKTFCKFLLLLIIVIVYGTNTTFAQWHWQNPLPQGVNLKDVYFVNENVGTAVGEMGAIVKTTDGGETWAQQESGSLKHLGSVSFFDENFGTAVGESGLILRTTDGGETWAQQSNGTTWHLYGVSFANKNVGMAVSGYFDVGSGEDVGLVFKTTNGGDTWTEHINYLHDSHESVFMVDENVAFLTGLNGLIAKTTDGGETWEAQNSGTSRELMDIHFSDRNHGIAVGSSSHCDVTMTTNGGETWVYNDALPSTKDLRGVWFSDMLNGTAVGISGTILRTTDGGTNWALQTAPAYFTDPSVVSFYSASFINKNTGWIIGSKGLIYKTTDGGANWVVKTKMAASPETVLRSVVFTGENTGIAAGDNGVILRTTNKGAEWVKQTSGTTGRLFSLSFPDANTGWAVGWGVTLKTTDGGGNWVSQTTGITSPLYDVFFVNTNTGWAVGGTKMVKTTDGGATWNILTGTESQIEAIYFVDENTGWICGFHSIIYKTTDGGTTWTEQPTPLTEDETLNDIIFLDANTGYIVGTKGAIIKTTNGGTTWTAQTSATHWSLTDVAFYDANIGTAAGVNGTIVSTTNGGTTWIYDSNRLGSETVNTDDAYLGICYAGANARYVVGAFCAILSTVEVVTPVELASFTANAAGSNVLLSWSTASETNNRGFEIERKAAEGSYTRIAFINGKGTTTEKQFYSCADNNLTAGKYTYRLKQMDYDGAYEYPGEVTVNVNMPQKYSLEQNYPNPFNPSTKISFSLAAESNITLKIYNILGEEVLILLNKNMEAGSHEIDFNAKQLNSGVYFYTLHAKGTDGNSFTSTKKMMLIK